MINSTITTNRKTNKNGNKSQVVERIATIRKANGDIQTRHFVCSDDKLATEIASVGYARFYDVEKGRLSTFDLSTHIGDIVTIG